MTQFVSSVPGVFNALLTLIQQAAAAQSPSVAVFPFELGQYEPGSYVTVHDIVGPRYEWETIGSFAQKEFYDIAGCATVYTGDSPATNPGVGVTVLSQTFSLLQSCVMTPVFSHRTTPLLGTTGPSPYLMLPGDFEYRAGPGAMGEGETGWCGVLTWSFHFEALITPA